MRPHRDLTLVAGAALACTAIALLVPVEPIRVIAAVPLVLLLPGYAVTAATFGRRPPDGPLLLTLVLGLSLSVLVLGVVALHVLPGRFGELSWAALLLAVVLGGCEVAGRRRGTAHTPGWPDPSALALPRFRRLDLGLLAGAAALLIAVVVLASTLLPASDAIGYTRLWMLPSKAGANVPHVSVGVVSEEQGSTIDRLVLEVGGRKTIRRMDLAPGERRVWRVIDPGQIPGVATPVEARLYLSSAPSTEYRRVTGWIPPG